MRKDQSKAMAKKSKRRRIFTTGRITGCGCLLVVALLAGAGWWAFPRIKDSLLPQYGFRPPESGSTEVTVERGDLTEAVSVYGAVSPARTQALAFSQAEGRITLVAAMEGMPVAEGDLLVSLDREALEREVALAKAERDEALEALEELAQEESPVRQLELQVALDEARSELSKAEEALAAFDRGEGGSAQARREAVEELQLARQRLASLQDDAEYEEQIARLEWQYNIAEVEHGPYVLIQNPSEQDRDKEWLLRNEMLARKQDLDTARLSREADLRAAQNAVAKAERTLRELDRAIAMGKDEVTRQELVAKVASAQAKVLEAESALAGDTLAEDTIEVAKAEAEVIKAEGALAVAERALADSELRAPFDGTVQAVKAMEGGTATRGEEMVTVADLSEIRVVAQVSELDMGTVKEGLEVQVILEAFGEEGRVPARVGPIPAYGRYQDGITVFDVPILLDREMPGLRLGMSASISIPVGVATDVLYIPVHAVYSGFEGSFVFVHAGDDVEQRAIKTGVSDGIMVEIIEGLEEGETVIVPMSGPGIYY